MATGDLIANVRPLDCIPDLGPLSISRLKGVGNYAGLSLGKSDGFTFLAQVPLNGTPVVVGLTLGIGIDDDPIVPGVGLAIRLGVTIKRLPTTSGTLADPTSTEVLATCTLNATAGIVTITPVAVPIADIASVEAGDWIEVHVRRVGTDSLDTHPGRPVCFGVVLKDT